MNKSIRAFALLATAVTLTARAGKKESDNNDGKKKDNDQVEQKAKSLEFEADFSKKIVKDGEGSDMSHNLVIQLPKKNDKGEVTSRITYKATWDNKKALGEGYISMSSDGSKVKSDAVVHVHVLGSLDPDAFVVKVNRLGQDTEFYLVFQNDKADLELADVVTVSDDRGGNKMIAKIQFVKGSKITYRSIIGGRLWDGQVAGEIPSPAPIAPAPAQSEAGLTIPPYTKSGVDNHQQEIVTETPAPAPVRQERAKFLGIF